LAAFERAADLQLAPRHFGVVDCREREIGKEGGGRKAASKDWLKRSVFHRPNGARHVLCGAVTSRVVKLAAP
jgi:hypothetical protein